MNYQHISMDDMNNGDGLRTVLWVSGCSHHCPGCQNPQTWNPKGGILFTEDAREEIFRNIAKPWIKGITFSGGDPLYSRNRKTVLSLMEDIKLLYPEKDIWCYTGYTFEEIKDLEVLPYIDVLVDGKYMEACRDVTLKWRGSSNQRVIDVKKTLEAGRVILHCD